ncbi:DUF2157 domain-containing protein [Carboxylicivirga sp. RSCT41]|uniref:DUF2157 domain-containing protein n=1 Tax=Carboxylicivirga agarovorans TaxID=3417570 RepID=UPI003D354D50
MSILREITELLNAGIIDQTTADRIHDYYSKKKGTSTNRLFLAFGILGAILVGLGIILIIAHNWDELSRSTKTLFAFLPLLAGQGLCFYSLIKKQHNEAWKESSAAFLFFAVGASISLVSQVYNIPGELSSYLLTWMLLCFPLIYVMKSSIVSLLYLIGITYYAAEVGYMSRFTSESYLYWLLLSLELPHYYYLYKYKANSNFMVFHNWLFPLSMVIVLGTVAYKMEELMFIAYCSLFGLMYLLGDTSFFSIKKLRNNGYKIIGSLGTIVLLIILSFEWFWVELISNDLQLNKVVVSPEFITSLIITLLAGGLLYLNQKGKSLKVMKPLAPVFLIFIFIFILGLKSPIAIILVNLCVFMIGILTIRDGAKENSLGILNFGLLIITVLIICRFFDTDLSFVFRGILFVLVGAGFFVANYLMLNKRKTNE